MKGASLPGRSYLPQKPVMFTVRYLKSWVDTIHPEETFATTIVARSRNFWWTQQYHMGLVIWAVFLGSEGKLSAMH